MRGAAGHSLVGAVTEHILSFDHGAAGADGKSTLINVVMSVLGIGGNGYAN
jgi:phage/plasmid-associated DNA primase